MNEQEILELANLISGISEATWSSAISYVHALVFQYAIWAGFFFVLSAVLAAVSRHYASKIHRSNDDEAAVLVCRGFSLFALFLGVCWVVASVNRAVAPEWYALQQILLHLQ